MKKIKLTTTAAVTAAILAGTTGAASAQVLIGAQFVDNATGNNDQSQSSKYVNPYTGVGVLGESFVIDSLGAVAGTPGNSAANGDNGVLGQDGSPNPYTQVLGSSGVSLTALSNSKADYVAERGGDFATNLYANGLELRTNNASTVTFTLSGLTAGSLYNVVLYGGNFGRSTNGNDHTGLTLTFNGAASAGISASANDAPAFVSGVNYLEDSLAANSSGDIVVVATASGNYTPINGISVQSAGAVPEPSVVGSMLLGAGALVGFQAFRRRNCNA